jgi:hypothetical protein
MTDGEVIIKERRKYPRHKRKARVVIARLPEGEERFNASLINISWGGMLVSAERDLPLHSRVWIRIEIGSSQVVNAVARLFQIRQDGSVYCFTHIPNHSRQALDGWLGRDGGLNPVAGSIG